MTRKLLGNCKCKTKRPVKRLKKEKKKMAKPIKGNKEVDEMALQKNAEACKYITDNLNELPQEVLVALLGKFDDVKIHIHRVLDWRLKQGSGGKYVARIHKLLDGLGARIAIIEEKLEIQPPSTKADENEATTQG